MFSARQHFALPRMIGRGLAGLGLLLLVSAALGGGEIPPPVISAASNLEAQHIYVCMLYSPDRSGVAGLTNYLKQIGARGSGALWTYTHPLLNQMTVIHVVTDFEGIKRALYTEGANVLILGHSNFGLGGVFATAKELSAQQIKTLYYMDDDRLMVWSSPWVSVNVPRIRWHQSFPNWWPDFQDGASAIMPLDFGDPRGAPPFNYYLTYQLPGDPIHYKIESVANSALERFPSSGKPAWYSPDGSLPDPANPAHRQYFLTATNTAFETVGIWVGTNFQSGYYGQDYLCVPGGTGLCQAGWFFSIPAAGNYTLSATWPGGPLNTTGASYIVAHAGGTTTVKKNQKLNGGKWIKLGVFAFAAGEYAVVLTDKASSQSLVIADAIRITSVANPGAFDQVVDNGPCPPTHYGKRTVLFRRGLDIDPDQMSYRRLFYEGCNSGFYYLDTFRRGVVFYTLHDSDGSGAATYLRSCLEGRSDEETWAALQRIQAIYDYYDFTKPPSEQGAAGAAAVAAPPASAGSQKQRVAELSQSSAAQAFAGLQEEEFISDEGSAVQMVAGAFGRRRAEGIALALKQLAVPGTGGAAARAPRGTRGFVAARRILAAFPDESVPRLLELYDRGNAITRGNVVRAAGGMPGDARVRDFLRAALEDKNVCEAASPEELGEPLRVCDVAYNQLVVGLGVKGVLRTIGPIHSLAAREYHIGVLKTRL